MQTNHPQAATSAAQNRPQTQAEMLRELLKDLELRITRLNQSSAHDALQIPVLLDQAVWIFARLHQAGSITPSEESHFDTIKAQFNNKKKEFLRHVGGPTALAKARQKTAPPETHWWWFVDQVLFQERRTRIRRWLVIGGLVIVVLTGFFGVYQRFWQPDPAIQASVGYQTMAENLLIEGRYEEALEQINQALANTPDNSSLRVLRGVIYELLEQPEKANADFEFALEDHPSADLFFSTRGGYYIMAGQPELALADAEAAFELNPNSATSILRKAQAYELLGDRVMAIKYYELTHDVAERTGNPQLQVIARMNMAQLLQSAPMITPETTE